MPTYCPELNPIETCWKITRHNVTNSNYFPTIEKLKKRLENFWQRHNFMLDYKLRTELLGTEQKSNFARYSYKIDGLLDKIPHYRPINSSIILKNEDLNKIIAIIKKYKITYETFDIKIPAKKVMWSSTERK